MQSSVMKRWPVPLIILFFIVMLVFPLGNFAFAENSSSVPMFSEDYELFKGDTGETGTGSENGLVPVSSKRLEEFRGKKIGAVTGATTGPIMEEYFDGDVHVSYFDTSTDMIQAMKSGKTDAYTVDNVCFINQFEADDSLAIVYPYIDTYGIKAFFPKGKEKSTRLREQYNEFLAELRSQDALEEIFSTYVKGEAKELDMTFTGENGALSVAVCSSLGKPYCFYMGQQLNGYELYLITEFAKKYGYSIEFHDFNFAGMLSAVSSGKCDMGATATQSTYERGETIDFSDAAYYLHHVLIVLRDDTTSGGFFNTIVNSFRKTFIVDNRWILFAEGVLNTLLITVLSAILGTFLGYALYKMSASGKAVPKKIVAGLAWIIRGMPTVVLLMILFYIVFGKVPIAGTWVAVVAFTLTFAVAMMGMIAAGVGAIDPGQNEGAIALGYTKKQAFRYIIFPQAVTHFMPLYSAEVISLIKATAIVGYIAVQDVTKVSDIIRSMTFEAFFPLIVVAILYFILGAILTAIVRVISRKVNRKERSRASILKGVITHD